MSVCTHHGAYMRFLLAASLATALAGCAEPEPLPPRTVVTRPLHPLGDFPSLATVPDRPPPPTGGVARAEELVDLGHDSTVAREADRELRATGPVPPPLPAASTVQPNFALLGGADSAIARRHAGRENAATSAAAAAPSMTVTPAGPIAGPAGDVPAAASETAQTRFAVRPPPGTAVERPGQPAAAQAPAGPVPSMPAAPPPAPDTGANAPPAPSLNTPAATIRFRLNSTSLGNAGLAQLDSFAQTWASTGRGLISLAVRRTDDLGPARERAVMEGLEKAGVPPGAVMTGRITLRPDVVELWRE